MNQETGLKCPRCGAAYVPTSELYLSCPNGHGKLIGNSMADMAKARREQLAFERRCDVAEQALRKLAAKEGGDSRAHAD